MSAMPSFKEMLNEIGSIGAALPKAKEDYLEADSTYDGRGIQLEKAVLKDAHEYLEEQNKRARKIRESAHALEENIRSFNQLRDSLRQSILFLLWQFAQTSISLQMEAISVLMPDPASRPGPAPGAGDPLAEVRSFLTDLNSAQMRLALLLARGVVAGRNVLGALLAAANLIRIRQAGMEAYLEEALTIDVDAAIAAVDIVAAELRQEGQKLVLEASAQAMNLAAETFVPILKIFTLGREFYEKIEEFKKRRQRTEVDDMCDFADSVVLENEAFKSTLAIFISIRESLATEIPKPI